MDNTTQTTNWRDLLVYDAEGDSHAGHSSNGIEVDPTIASLNNDGCRTLGDIVDRDPDTLAGATIEDGKITVWEQYFIAAPGEIIDWDSPRGSVDWAGFGDAVVNARNSVQA